MVKMAIYVQKCEQKWLRGVGIKMSWVEKNREINNRGGVGGIIRDSRVVRKIRPFSHEKVVITQSDGCR